MVALSVGYAAVGSVVAFLLGRRWYARPTSARRGKPTFASVWSAPANPPSRSRWRAGKRASGRALARLFAAIGPAWAAQTQGLSRLTGFSAGYLTLAPVFPILVATPRTSPAPSRLAR